MEVVISLEKPTDSRPQWKATVQGFSVRSQAASGDGVVRECQTKVLRELANKIACGDLPVLTSLTFKVVDA